MRVRNETDHGVFVPSYGVVAAGDEATVRESESVKELIKGGTLKEVQTSGGGSSSTSDKEGGAA